MQQSQQYYLKNDNKTLNIPSVTSNDDASHYSCVAKNSVGIGKSVFVINRLTPPRLTLNFSDGESKFDTILVSRKGDAVDLMCPFDHFNHIEWFKNGEPFNNKTTIIGFPNISIADAGTNAS